MKCNFCRLAVRYDPLRPIYGSSGVKRLISDVLLNVHLSIILVINQLNSLIAELNPICHLLALLGAHHILHVSRVRVNAQILVFLISLLYSSTCFEHYVLIIRRSKLYYTASGIITPVGGRLVHRTAYDLHATVITGFIFLKCLYP